ncbi:MAG: ATP-dependent helicase [Candidatus Hydrothermarchaeota archaeon]
MKEEIITEPKLSDEEILNLFDDTIREWWIRTFSSGKEIFTPPQKIAVPLIYGDENVLICAPTGSGKTLSAFISIINKLFVLSKNEGLSNSVYCLYISPLRSLANDINKNLEQPLSEIKKIASERGLEVEEIRHAIRHGDISTAERSKMLKKTPHILNTTPETLGILLNSPRFKEKLKTVRWVIVDEIHSLAGSKRGVHLSLSLERLEEIASGFVRIGCSATIEPLEEVGRFLVGKDRQVKIVDTRFARKFDIRLLCPVPDLIYTTSEELSNKLYEMIHNLVNEHKNTLIFTNTRNGAERVLYNLRTRYPEFYNEENSGCHHGSMGKHGRVEIEDKLKNGDIKVVTSSTSLELGIDMPHLDLVIQIGSPKSVAALLQRIGRAGHSLDQIVKGRIIALDRDELIECAVMLKKGKEGFVDKIHIPKNCLDVLCQHLYGMSLEKRWNIEDVKRIIKRSYCYENIRDEDFMSVINYLSGRYAGLEERNVYAKIWYDEETNMIGRRGKYSRMIYFLNLGTIPDEFSCDVYTRDDRWVGKLDEKYLERLNRGDVFVLGGKKYKFRYRRGGNIYVDVTNERPTIPNWFSERLPLSFDLGKHVLMFKAEMIELMKNNKKEDVLKKIMEEYPIDENSARSIYEIFDHQIRYLGHDSISTVERIVIEENLDRENYRRNFYVLTNYGMRFNDGFSRMLAYLISERETSNISIAICDTGFLLSLPINRKVNLKNYLIEISKMNCEDILERSVENTHLLKRIFRINAARSFMILRNYKGRKKSARRQQISADMLIYFAKKLDDFAVLRESYREIIEDKFEVENIKEILGGIKSGKIQITEKFSRSPSPMAFGIATMGASDVVFVKDKLALLRDFHKRVMETIEGEV